MFSGSFGVRSIVLCKCSGKYIDIYFILKITFLNCGCSFCMLLSTCNQKEFVIESKLNGFLEVFLLYLDLQIFIGEVK